MKNSKPQRLALAAPAAVVFCLLAASCALLTRGDVRVGAWSLGFRPQAGARPGDPVPARHKITLSPRRQEMREERRFLGLALTHHQPLPQSMTLVGREANRPRTVRLQVHGPAAPRKVRISGRDIQRFRGGDIVVTNPKGVVPE